MPIRPENRDRYPADWPAISARIREREGYRCKWCGVKNHELGGRDAQGRWHRALPLGNGGRGPSGLEWPAEGSVSWCSGNHHLRIVRIVLTVAHLDHTPENCAEDNLVALCQRCHNLYDMPHRRAGIFERARAGNVVRDLFASTTEASHGGQS